MWTSSNARFQIINQEIVSTLTEREKQGKNKNKTPTKHFLSVPAYRLL